jgi:hypothetical protein
MKPINRIYPLSAFLALILFSQVSNAIIITSYTALYEDGSKLVVDLKGYDYGIGSYYASPTDWDEAGLSIEGFNSFLYPSLESGLAPGKLGGLVESNGLHFKVDEYYGVSMTAFRYIDIVPDFVLSNFGLFVGPRGEYKTEFSGGFFKTAISPYPVGEPGSLALMIIGVAGLGWARLLRKPGSTGTLF